MKEYNKWYRRRQLDDAIEKTDGNLSIAEFIVPPARFSDASEGKLTKAIIAYVNNVIGGFATRISPEGRARQKAIASGGGLVPYSVVSKGYRIPSATVPGIADVYVELRATDGESRPFWFECKSPKGKQSPLQRSFEKKIKAVGGNYHVVRTMRDFLAVIWRNRERLKLPKNAFPEKI